MPIPRRRETVERPLRGLADRCRALQELLGILVVPPEGWQTMKVKGGNGNGKKQQGDDEGLKPKTCESYVVLRKAWKDALEWTPGLEHALTSMLASIASVKLVGDQLWLKVLGPASCGKSVLCEALSVAKEYVVAKSSVRGFHSGYRLDGDKGSEGESKDNSLVSELFDMTLITKDGDTLLQAPNKSQILAEGRDIYDGTSRTHYRNDMGKDYEGLRMTWLLCGTSSLRSIDQSELGERFLDIVIMEGIDEELEDKVLWRVVNRAAKSIVIETDRNSGSCNDPEMTEAMQLTGGYVSYLRENAAELASQVRMPEWAKRLTTRLGKFTALMRARPSYMQEETAEREFGARLAITLTRLAVTSAMVLGKKETDHEVMRRVAKTATDTGRGQTLDIVQVMYEKPNVGMTTGSIALRVGKTEVKTGSLMRFLAHPNVNVAEKYDAQTVTGLDAKWRWRLTPMMRELYDEVLEELDAES